MFNPCIVIPCFNHAAQFRKFLPHLVSFAYPIIVVDDGCADSDAAALRSLAESYNFTLVRLGKNRGKGEALRAGLQEAVRRGFTHALQCDADGQHEAEAVDRFFKISQMHEDYYICGDPVYDRSAPKSRLYGRKITDFWVAAETLSLSMGDALCGFRVYPLKKVIPLLEKEVWGRGMGFDIRILVEMYWAGVPLMFAPLKVVYPPDGHSNFSMLRGNIDVSITHAMLFCRSLFHLRGNLRGVVTKADKM